VEGAKLATEEFRGTRHIYRIDPTGLVAVRAWLDRFWTNSLEAFAAEVERENQKPAARAKRRGSSRA